MCAMIIIKLSLYQEMSKTYILGAGMAKAASSSLCTPAPAHVVSHTIMASNISCGGGSVELVYVVIKWDGMTIPWTHSVAWNKNGVSHSPDYFPSPHD